MTETAARTSDHILDPGRPRFALQLAILSFVVVVQSDPRRALVGAVLAVTGLLVDDVIESRWFWWFTAVFMGAWFFLEWPLLDNHVALSVYWALAIALVLGRADWTETLAESGRWIIVTVFALSVFWKVVSPDFASGDFFEWTLLVDPRFVPLAELAGVGSDALAANRELVASGSIGILHTSRGVAVAAKALTVGTYVIEGAVAIVWALGKRAGNLRHWGLGIFAFLTYVMVPVAGFGFMLLVIGAATVQTAWGRLGYAIGALALFLYSVAWTVAVL